MHADSFSRVPLLKGTAGNADIAVFAMAGLSRGSHDFEEFGLIHAKISTRTGFDHGPGARLIRLHGWSLPGHGSITREGLGRALTVVFLRHGARTSPHLLKTLIRGVSGDYIRNFPITGELHAPIAPLF